MTQKIVAWALIALLSQGCTTLGPIAGGSGELQQRINSGELLKAGDRVEIVTSDGQTHSMTVSGIIHGRIDGTADGIRIANKEESIQVDQVVSLQKRHFSLGKTLALVGGIALVVIVAIGVSAAEHPLSHFTL